MIMNSFLITLHIFHGSQKMATLSPFPSLTTTTTKLHNSLPSSPKFSPFSPHSHHATIRFRYRFSRRAKLNNYSGEEARKVVDEAFSFGVGDDDLAEDDDVDGDGEEEEEEEEEREESSVDLLLRFLQSMVKKISRRAKKATRSVLPPAISSQLVSFAVDGLMLLASLSIVKALLEVVCTLGGTVFVAILLLRVIWSILSYFQTSGSNFSEGGSSYGPAQTVS